MAADGGLHQRRLAGPGLAEQQRQPARASSGRTAGCSAPRADATVRKRNLRVRDELERAFAKAVERFVHCRPSGIP